MGSAFGIAWDAATHARPAAVGIVAAGAFAVQLRAMFVPVGDFGWLTALAFPLLMTLFFVVFFRSLWCTTVTHEVTWRDRTLAVGSRVDSGESGR